MTAVMWSSSRWSHDGRSQNFNRQSDYSWSFKCEESSSVKRNYLFVIHWVVVRRAEYDCFACRLHDERTWHFVQGPDDSVHKTCHKGRSHGMSYNQSFSRGYKVAIWWMSFWQCCPLVDSERSRLHGDVEWVANVTAHCYYSQIDSLHHK